jgi:hypothetical protein
MNPIYSRRSGLIRSRKGVTQYGEGFLQGLLLPTLLTKKLRRRKKVQKGGWISTEVSKPPGYDQVPICSDYEESEDDDRYRH